MMIASLPNLRYYYKFNTIKYEGYRLTCYIYNIYKIHKRYDSYFCFLRFYEHVSEVFHHQNGKYVQRTYNIKTSLTTHKKYWDWQVVNALRIFHFMSNHIQRSTWKNGVGKLRRKSAFSINSRKISNHRYIFKCVLYIRHYWRRWR